MLCGSGLKSVQIGYQSIKSGDSSIVISGGQESMTQAPHAVQLRAGVKLGPTTLIDTMIHDGLTDAFNDIHMGITAENCNKKYENTREQQDAYAARSQQLAEAAQKNGYFTNEIVPVSLPSRGGATLFEAGRYIFETILIFVINISIFKSKFQMNFRAMERLLNRCQN